MPISDSGLTIGGLARAADVNVETIRFYQRRGLMPEPDRLSRGIRRYRDADLSRLSFIRSAQRLGFSLDEIADLLGLEDGSSCGQARHKAEAKLADVKAKLADPPPNRRSPGEPDQTVRGVERQGSLSIDRRIEEDSGDLMAFD